MAARQRRRNRIPWPRTGRRIGNLQQDNEGRVRRGRPENSEQKTQRPMLLSFIQPPGARQFGSGEIQVGAACRICPTPSFHAAPAVDEGSHQPVAPPPCKARCRVLIAASTSSPPATSGTPSRRMISACRILETCLCSSSARLRFRANCAPGPVGRTAWPRTSSNSTGPCCGTPPPFLHHAIKVGARNELEYLPEHAA